MTDFERNYFGTGPRPATMTVASTSAAATAAAVGVPRKRGVLVRTNSNRDSQLTDEWQEQPEEPLIPLTNGGGGARDGRTSSLRRPVLNGNSVSSANGVAVGSGAVAAVKKEVNFVSPTKSDTEQPVKTHRRSDVKKMGEDPTTTEQRLLHQQQQNSRLRRNSETEHSFEDQVLVLPARQRQLSSSSGADEDVKYETRNVDQRRQGTNYSSAIVSHSRRDSSRTGPQGTNGNTSSPHEKEQKCSTTDPVATITGRDCDWNPAAEAISYYSDSTGSNSVTMPTVTTTCAPGSGYSDTAAAAIELDRMRRRPARFHASSWSLSSNCGGLSKAAIAHDDSRFGTIRSVQSECRTSSTSQLNRSGSLKRVKGRSNQSLCSCDAETEVRTETDGDAMKGH